MELLRTGTAKKNYKVSLEHILLDRTEVQEPAQGLEIQHTVEHLPSRESCPTRRECRMKI